MSELGAAAAGGAPARAPEEVLTATFGALADPTRRAILARLAQGEATVNELAEPFALSLPGVSKHLKVLRQAGLVVQGRDRQRRPCRLDVRPLREAVRWLEHYRGFWEESYQRLDALLDEMQQQPGGPAGRAET